MGGLALKSGATWVISLLISLLILTRSAICNVLILRLHPRITLRAGAH